MKNGQVPDWKTLRHQRLALQETVRIQQLEQSRRLLENLDLSVVPQAEYLRQRRAHRVTPEAVDLPNWVFAYQDIWDRLRDGWEFISPFTSKRDRQFGVNFPIFRTEQELSILRAPSRIICATNNYAKGLLNGLSAFVINTGYRYHVLPRGERADKAFLRRVQRVVDEFIDQADWNGMEQELFWRSREDGEFFLRLGLGEDGKTWIRTVEPEQVTQKPNTDFEEWSFGVQTHREDTQNVLSYWVSYESDPVLGEEIDPGDMVHFKANVKRSIKRGVPDFAFSAYDTLVAADKLRRNMGEGAAIQAAIAGIREHQTSSLAQVQAFQTAITDFSKTDPITTRTGLTQKMEPGTILDTGQNTKWVNPPAAANAAAHVEILDALTRGAAAAWNAPEWLVSASAANMGGYTSSLVAESPFVIRVKSEQNKYKRAFLMVILQVIRHAIMTGMLPPETLRLVVVEVMPPLIEHRDKLLEAQTNQTYVMMKTKAPQTVMKETGLDPEDEMLKMEEFEERMGQGEGLDMPTDEEASSQDPKLGTPTHPLHGGFRERSGYQRGESEPLGMPEAKITPLELLEAHQEMLIQEFGAPVAQAIARAAQFLANPGETPAQAQELPEARQGAADILETLDDRLADLRQFVEVLKQDLEEKKMSPIIQVPVNVPAARAPVIHMPDITVEAPQVTVPVQIDMPRMTKKKTTHLRDEQGIIVQSIEEPEYQKD